MLQLHICQVEINHSHIANAGRPCLSHRDKNLHHQVARLWAFFYSCGLSRRAVTFSMKKCGQDCDRGVIDFDLTNVELWH